MFNLFKPAYVQLQSSLAPAVAREYDEVLSSFIDHIPTYWSKGAQDRAITIVMAEWVMANAAAGRLPISGYLYSRAARFDEICRMHNERDYAGHGGSSNAFANDIIRALREAEIIPMKD